MAFDPHYASVGLLLHGDGADNSTTFTDSSPTPKTVTGYGNAQISTAQSKWGGASIKFDGAGDYLSAPESIDLQFGTGDFSIEASCYFLDVTAEQVLISARDAAKNIYSNIIRVKAGKLGWSNGTVWVETSSSVPALTWRHIAVTRSAGTLRIFIHGVAEYTGAQPVDIAGARPLFIGASDDPGYRFFSDCYVDDIRITKGVARYTANFTPPTEAFANSATPTSAGISSTAFGLPTAFIASNQSRAASGFTAALFGQPHVMVTQTATATASGFGPVAFGSPAARLTHGASSLLVGTAFGTPALRIAASGFRRTSFGIPGIELRAAGLQAAVAFGTPNGIAIQPATGFSSTSFGTPAHPHLQTVTATGWEVTSMGRPVAATYTQAVVNRTVSATALRPVKFGLATAGAQVSTRASGQTSTTFGSPNSRRAQPAQSLAPTVTFGLPSASAGTRATGFQAPSFGTPTTRTTHRAASVYRATRWGLPAAERSNTYKARGIDLRARFGQPAAHCLNAYRATAGAPTTQFGTPVATPRYRAFHLPPETRFGKPRLIRSPAC